MVTLGPVQGSSTQGTLVARVEVVGRAFGGAA
jgi:hypothetical protein